MAHILIDGYNLIGTAHDNLEKTRNDLIEKLREYASQKNHMITVVFDGWKSGQKDQTRITARHVTVIYSRIGDKADDVIIRTLSSSTKPWIVVSSDREISDYAFKKDFASVTSAEFEDKLFLALNGLKYERDDNDMAMSDELIKYDDDEVDSPSSHRKGNPRKQSKRQKKKIQALRKL
jgi:predicted RNA-binding protein with PIN domain